MVVGHGQPLSGPLMLVAGVSLVWAVRNKTRRSTFGSSASERGVDRLDHRRRNADRIRHGSTSLGLFAILYLGSRSSTPTTDPVLPRGVHRLQRQSPANKPKPPRRLHGRIKNGSSKEKKRERLRKLFEGSLGTTKRRLTIFQRSGLGTPEGCSHHHYLGSATHAGWTPNRNPEKTNQFVRRSSRSSEPKPSQVDRICLSPLPEASYAVREGCDVKRRLRPVTNDQASVQGAKRPIRSGAYPRREAPNPEKTRWYLGGTPAPQSSILASAKD